ncbi:P-loop containing nucleoside triphosphate hydrolase, partial [Candidatus Phytoplasma phoenicium]
MKKLTKIQLINWHLFVCQTIEIKDNTLISGENGAGKSTLLDALQYVLIGGKSGVKFNIAANDNAKRSLENYIKGKIGAENKEFLRNKDVITHICLEFYDEKTQKNSLLGCLLELPYKGLLKEKFYFCTNQTLTSELFVNNNKPFNAQQFRYYMKILDPHFEFCETKKQYQNTLEQFLKINISKYIKILPKALSFKPLNLQNFVFEFLLEENPINIISLKNSVQQLRKVEKQIELEKQKLKKLKVIIEKSQEIKLLEQNTKINFLIEKMLINLQFQAQIQNIKQQQTTLTQQISYLLTQKKENNFAIENLNNYILQLQNYKNQDNVGAFLYSLQKDLAQHQMILKETEQQINLFQTQLKTEKDLCAQILLSYPSVKLQKHLNYLNQWCRQVPEEEITEQTYTSFKKNILNINDELSYEIIQVNIQQSELHKEIHDLQQKINELNNHLEILQSITPTYHPSLRKLKSLLTTHLSSLYQKEISIYPLCELIDIKEELWRNAIEGFLGMRKFNLIIDERYFQASLKIYEKFQSSEKIYDIGLVNIGKIPVINENPQSLAAKIFTENTDALKYTRILLSHIICELEVTNLQKHKIAITPQGMIYSNYTAKQLNPKTYQIPYIGVNSKKIRQQILIDELNQFNKSLKEKQNKWHYNENFIFLMHKSKFSTILEQDPWVFYQKSQKNKEIITKIQNKIQELKINPHLNELEDNLAKVQKEKE